MNKLLILLCFGFLFTNVSAQKNGAITHDTPHVYGGEVYEKPGKTLPQGAGEQEVADFIRNHKSILSETDSDLALESYRESPGGFHYQFLQTYNGVPIQGAGIKANLNKQYKVTSLMNNLRTFTPDITGNFAFSDADVELAVTASHQNNQTRFELRTARLFQITENGLRPVYVVETDGNIESMEVILDATDLSLISERDRAIYHHHTKKVTADTNGVGFVFNPDPLTTAGVNYGGNYVDNNDANSTFLNSERVAVVLEDITETGGTFYLTGPHVTIDNSLENPQKPATTSFDGNFDYLRSNDNFEAVMCYYHVDHYQRYIQSLGFNNIYNSSILVDPHGLNGNDNSHFVPNGVNSRIAFGEGGVDDAEDADVIVHEYGHALSNSASPNSNSGTERNGLDEGFGDYIAASYSRSINAFRWEDVFTWDGHNAFWGGRSAKTTMTYPPGGFNFYDYGEIWATALMRAWDSLGQTISDRVFFQELYSNSANMTTNDAAHLILDADSALYSGSHTRVYQAIFCDMNIFTGGECVVSVDDRIVEDFRWSTFPNPANNHLTVYIPSIYSMGDISLEIYDIAGRKVASQPAHDFETQLNTDQLDNGMYIIRLLEDGEHTTSKKVMVSH